MTDPLLAAPEAVIPPAPTVPGMTAAEIEALVDRKAQEISDKRVAGLQSMYDKKISDLATEQRKIRKSFSNDEDDSPDPRVADLEAELARVQQDAALAAAQREFPDVFDDYAAISAFGTAAEQLAYLREMRTKLSVAPTTDPAPAPAVEDPTPPVDPNQPVRNEPRFEPQSMDLTSAWDIIKANPAWPRR